jgi:hypothetical protein
MSLTTDPVPDEVKLRQFYEIIAVWSLTILSNPDFPLPYLTG